MFFTARIHRMGEGNSFSLLVCPQGRRVLTLARSKVPTPSPPGQGTYHPARSGWGGGEKYPKVPTPLTRSAWGRGYPKVPTHPPTAKVPTPPVRSGQGGYLKVPTPWPRHLPPWPGQGRGRGYPKVPTPPLAKVPTPCQGLAIWWAVCLLCSRRRTFLSRLLKVSD